MSLHPQEFDEDGYPVCSECGACYENHGLGTACNECRHRDLIECEADYMEHEFTLTP